MKTLPKPPAFEISRVYVVTRKNGLHVSICSSQADALSIHKDRPCDIREMTVVEALEFLRSSGIKPLLA